ncbi:MAG: hypothetical protein ISS15_16610 [Alphaproteobacteria bacterium]|nr:hypothetical protein [Alphaproteobacteria bacterium]MBL6937893.1 hypothetical protein [Alphaproteobacteria bacterium]MBL7099282.1 hypothetical protein [Alphaproteobacteria bacterium]
MLIGGSSNVGKSTVAGILGARPGWTARSTDRMGRHPGRPWPTGGQSVKPHVAAHYSRLSQVELIRSVLTHYRNMEPSIRALVETHARDKTRDKLVLEGSGLLPETVAAIDPPAVSAVWLTADDATFTARIRRESSYDALDAQGRALVDAFLGRTLRYNTLVMDELRRRGLPYLDVSDAASPADMASAVLAAARPLG